MGREVKMIWEELGEGKTIKIYHLIFFLQKKKKSQAECRLAEGGDRHTLVLSSIPARLPGQSAHSWICQNPHLQSWGVHDHCGVSGLAVLLWTLKQVPGARDNNLQAVLVELVLSGFLFWHHEAVWDYGPSSLRLISRVWEDSHVRIHYFIAVWPYD